MWSEFKSFAAKGSVMDMAVGIVIGTAFGAVVRSLVDDLLMPPIGLLLGDTDFADLFVVLKQGTPAGPYATLEAANTAGAVTWRYGLFLSTVVTFLIVALAMFLLVRWVVVRLEQDEEIAEASSRTCDRCRMTVAEEATRCPHCTSNLQGADATDGSTSSAAGV